MKPTIYSPDEQRRVDPPLMRLLQMLPAGDGDPVAVVPVTRLEGFRFRAELPKLIGGKPWVLVDFSEFGPSWDQASSWLWGRDRCEHPRFVGEWCKLDAFVREHPPVLTFQRELLRQDVSDRVLPIDYPNYSAPVQPDSEAQFHARPLDVLFNWGLSSHYRPVIHGDLFAQSTRLGYDVCSQWDHLDGAIRRKDKPLWAAIHTPHYARIPSEEMIRWFGRAKIVVAAPGEGRKTFRHGEINNSAVAIQPDKLAYSVNIKGIRLVDDAEAESLWEALSGDDLYAIYLMNHAAADALRPARYISEWLLANIEKRL